MAKETVEKILAAENSADSRLEKAARDAEGIVSSARANADGIVLNARRDANEKGRRLAEETARQIEDMFSSNADECARIKRKVTESASGKIERAIDYVLSSIVGE